MSDIVNITIEVLDQVSATISTVGTQGPAGSDASATTNASLLTSGTLDDARLSDQVVLLSVMQAAPTWAAIYATTTDPGIAGVPWNNAGHFVFSTGFTNGSMDFSAAQYSQYLSLVEDI